MILKHSLVVLFVITVIVGVVTGQSFGASEEGRDSKLIEGAKTEGKMVLYTTQNIPDSTRMIKKFEEKYPFIKVDLFRAVTVILVNKITNEAKARKYIPDVIEIPGFQASVLKKEHLYSSYRSPENRAYQEGFKDPEGTWTSTYVLPYVMAYNSRLLSRKDIPDTYEGFITPKWKGKKIGFNTKEVEWFANMLKIMGEEKGTDFIRRLVAQGLNYRRDNTLIRDLIIAGEFPVGTAYPNQVEETKQKGANVDWVGVSPVIAKLGTIGLAAHASHPNAAKLYIDFCLSKEGQMVTVACNRLPARTGIEADILKSFKDIKLYPSDVSLAEKFTAYSKQYAALLR